VAQTLTFSVSGEVRHRMSTQLGTPEQSFMLYPLPFLKTDPYDVKTDIFANLFRVSGGDGASSLSQKVIQSGRIGQSAGGETNAAQTIES